jgi:hypothetical protein
MDAMRPHWNKIELWAQIYKAVHKNSCFSLPAGQELFALGWLFGQAAHVRDQIGQLIVGQFAAISGHLVFAFFGDIQELGIRLLLDFRAREILYGKFFAGYAARGVRAVADLAFHLVQGLGGILGAGLTYGAQEQTEHNDGAEC